MICNFFVAFSAMIAHRKTRLTMNSVLKYLIPAAMAFIIVGVALSNTKIFSGSGSYLLCQVFAIFMLYAAIYNIVKLYYSFRPRNPKNQGPGSENNKGTNILSGIIGLVTGTFAGLLGIGAGSVATPMQQYLLKIPIKNAMANSSVTIVSIAAIGALFKNMTLSQHEVAFGLFDGAGYILSIKIAAMIIPSAMAGGIIGVKLMHFLPTKVVRGVFIIILLSAAIKLLTIK
jgi:uncharacterized membrane protein YfcA